jgi:glyoxylase-like metal-dependent hydrolase (beta-lactamase superfamily II)
MSITQVEPALRFDSNMYLIVGSERTALIDTGTGFAVDATIDSLKKHLGGRKLDIVILTHRHYDHVGGLRGIIKEFSPVLYAGPEDAAPLREGDSESTLGTKFGGSIDPMGVIDFCEGDRIDLGGHVLRSIYTPGHTIGSICVLDEVTGSLFSGDTVFVDGVGNTMHPTGSEKMLIDSLKKLSEIQFSGLYPGHGPIVTSGGQEYVAKGLKMMGA